MPSPLKPERVTQCAVKRSDPTRATRPSFCLDEEQRITRAFTAPVLRLPHSASGGPPPIEMPSTFVSDLVAAPANASVCLLNLVIFALMWNYRVGLENVAVSYETAITNVSASSAWRLQLATPCRRA